MGRAQPTEKINGRVRRLTGFPSPSELAAQLVAKEKEQGFVFTANKVNSKGKLGSATTTKKRQRDGTSSEDPVANGLPVPAAKKPRATQASGAGNGRRLTKCGLCHLTGHNRRTCPQRVVPAPVPVGVAAAVEVPVASPLCELATAVAVVGGGVTAMHA